MSTTTTRTAAPRQDVDRLAKAFAVLRIFFGLVFLLNGLAKLTGVHRVEFGPYLANLINRPDTKFILDVEANTNARHQMPLLGRIVNDVLLPNWAVVQWLITFGELTIGLLLVLGLASRFGALLGLGQALSLYYLYFANDRWLFEQPLEVVPLTLLALVPSGRVWGLDGRLPWKRARAGRWPF
jgi:uncharacterized membrane protein YphA (DoxX/SURF4 family)